MRQLTDRERQVLREMLEELAAPRPKRGIGLKVEPGKKFRAVTLKLPPDLLVQLKGCSNQSMTVERALRFFFLVMEE